MPKRKPLWFMIDQDLADRLEANKVKMDVSVAEQIRRAIRYWLESNEWLIVGRTRRTRGPDMLD
jgi:sRNA-binding protein